MTVNIFCTYKRPNTSIDWRPPNPKANFGTWFGYEKCSDNLLSNDGLTMSRVLVFDRKEHFTDPSLSNSQRDIYNNYIDYLKNNNIKFTYAIEE